MFDQWPRVDDKTFPDKFIVNHEDGMLLIILVKNYRHWYVKICFRVSFSLVMPQCANEAAYARFVICILIFYHHGEKISIILV